MKRRQSWSMWRPAFLQRSNASAVRGQCLSKKTARLNLETLEERTLLSAPQLIAPIASNDVQPTDGATPLVLQSLGYFSVVDGATLVPSSVTITTKPTHGNAVMDPSTGNITYTAFAGFAGTDTVGFTVTDSNGLTSQPAYVNEVVTLPVANPVTAGTEAGQPVTIDVLATDASVAAPLDPTSVQVPTNPSHGSVSINGTTGSIQYTSAASFSGTDTFTYTVKDSNGIASNPATVTVVVTRPQANDDFATTQEGIAVVIPVLSQDTGPSALVPSSVHVLSAPGDGTYAIDPATGNIKYTPNSGFSGVDSFTYTVADLNNAVSNTATVTIAVQLPAGGTVVNPVATSTDSGTPVIINVLAADSSTVGFMVNSVTVTSGPADGATSVASATGDITYTPTAGFSGIDSFTYAVTDNNSVTNSAVVTVVVNAPKANDTFGVTTAGQSVVIAVLAGDNDVDNPLVPGSVKVVSGPAHGSTTVDPITGHVTYTANASFAGTDSFTYTVKDANNVVSNPATVTVISNRPGATDEFGTTDSGFPITIDTLADDTDPAGAAALVPSSVTILSGPSNGTATIDTTTGNITYKSIFGFNGTDTLTYTVQDTSGAVSNVGTISIVVNRPTAEPDFATTMENTAVTMNIAANDSDPDGNQFLVPTSITITTPPTNGSVTVSGAGIVTYTPAYGFVGTDTFAYTIADAHGATSNPAIDSVTVTGSMAPKPVIIGLPDQPGATSVVGQSANSLYVKALFRDILGRQADSAGLNYWVGRLQAGVSQAAVVRFIMQSGEHYSDEVMDYYSTFLNRTPGSAEVKGWVNNMLAGETEQQVESAFLTSPEFMAKNGSDSQFVSALYTDVLGRSADSAGLAGWLGGLSSKALTRAQVAQAFLNSGEALKDIVDANYAALLARTADGAGEANWVGFLQHNQGAQDFLGIEFLLSTEYANDVAAGIR
jgi:hypothetical protein